MHKFELSWVADETPRFSVFYNTIQEIRDHVNVVADRPNCRFAYRLNTPDIPLKVVCNQDSTYTITADSQELIINKVEAASIIPLISHYINNEHPLKQLYDENSTIILEPFLNSIILEQIDPITKLSKYFYIFSKKDLNNLYFSLKFLLNSNV